MQSPLLSIIYLLITPIISTDITCNPGIDCIIDETNINSNETNTINAQNATTLILKCYQQSCRNAIIKCPNDICNIICNDAYSCEYAQITTYTNTKLTLQSFANKSAKSILITGDNTNEINLICHENESCESADIYDSNAQNINIFCATRPNLHDSCSYLKIYAENASNININCGDEPADEISGGSCERAELHINNANNVNIIAHDIQYGIIKASNVNHFNLTCISKWTMNDGCYHTDIYFPNTTEPGVNSFNCYGSCPLLDIYDIKCDVFNAMNINLNGCGLKDNIYDFMNVWSFWYNGVQNAIDYNSVQHNVTCFPWQDDEFIQSCNCSDMLDVVSNLFIDDASMEECNVLYDGVSTTLFPIFNTSMTTTSYYTTLSSMQTDEPSFNPTTSPTINGDIDDKNEKQMKGGILALVIILPIGAVLIVIGLVCFQKRKSGSEYKHQKVKVSDNDEEVDYDMENVPIATHVQMESPNTTY